MEQKFLPIGSVCTLKGKTKKVMITGYCSVEFNGNLKIDDYLGCAFPEGMLLPEFVCNFNHTDIESIDFVGFRNDDQLKFNSLLDRLTENDSETKQDADGWVLSSNKSYSKILFDENGVVVLAEPVKTDSKEKSKIIFDENGIVTGVEEVKVENPFYKDYSTMNIETQNTNNTIFTKYKFDENGILVEDNSNKFDNKDELLNKIEFDENGIVVADHSQNSNEVKPSSKYKFDENGILIEVAGEKEEDIPAIGPGLPGYVAPKFSSNYKFDENGILIEVAEEKEEEIPAIGPGLPGYVAPKKVDDQFLDYDLGFEENSMVDIYELDAEEEA